MRDEHAWQPAIDAGTLLPHPTVEDLEGIATLAFQCLVMHTGKVADASGSIHTPAAIDQEGDILHVFDVPDPTSPSSISCLAIGYMSEDKVMEDVVVLEAGLDWEESPEGCDFEPGEKVAVISVLFNRRWSAYEMMKHSVYGFYELVEVLAHEVAHAMDRENTMHDPEYIESHGEKASHQYLFNECEVRARVWAALVAYCHLYVYATITDRWDWLTLPSPTDSDEKWHKFLSDCPFGDGPLDEMNVENRSIFVQMFSKEAGRLLEEVRQAIADKTMPALAGFDATAYGGCKKRPKEDDPDPIEAYERAAERCVEEWRDE